MSPALVMWSILRYYIVIPRYILIFLSFVIPFFIPCQGSSCMFILFNGHHGFLQDKRNHPNKLSKPAPSIHARTSNSKSSEFHDNEFSPSNFIFFLPPLKFNTQIGTTFQKTQLVCSVAQDVRHTKPLHLKQFILERMGQKFVCHFLLLIG